MQWVDEARPHPNPLPQERARNLACPAQPSRKGVNPVQKRSEISEIIVEINDLREFGHPRLRRWESRVEEKRQSAIATQGTQGTQGTQRTKGKNPLSLCPFAAFGGEFISGFVRPLFPLPNVKERAPERLTYSTLPRLDGNATTIIQIVSAPRRFSALSTAFSRAEGAEGAEVEMGKWDATYCETVTCICIRKGNLPILCARCVSARAFLSRSWTQGPGNRKSTPNGSNPTRSAPIGKNYG
jgi:hypothetical protein